MKSERKIAMISESNPGLAYEVSFFIESRDDGSYASLRCNCPAADFQETICKHEKAILAGDCSLLADRSTAQIVEEAAALFSGSEFGRHHAEFEKQMKAIDLEEKQMKEEIKKRRKAAKNAIGSLLASGIRITR